MAESEQSYAAMSEEEERRQRRIDVRTLYCSHSCAGSRTAKLMKLLVDLLHSRCIVGLS